MIEPDPFPRPPRRIVTEEDIRRIRQRSLWLVRPEPLEMPTSEAIKVGNNWYWKSTVDWARNELEAEFSINRTIADIKKTREFNNDFDGSDYVPAPAIHAEDFQMPRELETVRERYTLQPKTDWVKMILWAIVAGQAGWLTWANWDLISRFANNAVSRIGPGMVAGEVAVIASGILIAFVEGPILFQSSKTTNSRGPR